MAKQFNSNVGKARVSKKSRNALEGCLTSMPLTHICGHGHDCDMTQRFRLGCITPSSLGLALTLLCLRKEDAKLSCDSWRLIQQEYCWLVMGERTGIRSYSARVSGDNLEGSSWEPGCQEENPTPRFLTQTPIIICSVKHSLLGSITSSPNKNRNRNYHFNKVYTHWEATTFSVFVHVSKSSELTDNQMVYPRKCHSPP